MRKLCFGAAILFLSLSACSTAKVHVMAGEDGVNHAIATDYEKDKAQDAALSAAEDYCKDRSKTVLLVEQKPTQYTGTMNESTRNTIRGFSEAALLMSPMTGVATQNPLTGSAVGSAGVAGMAATDHRDYESEVRFKCQ